MIRIGTEVVYPPSVDDDKQISFRGEVDRNSMRTGCHLVRVNDRWFDREHIVIVGRERRRRFDAYLGKVIDLLNAQREAYLSTHETP